MRRIAATAAMFVTAATTSAVAAPAASADGTLANGFTAKVIAASGDTITGTIDATGYDVGVYVGPGVHDVTISHAAVSGANDEGVLIQDASDVIVRNSAVNDNGVAPADGVSELKAIVVAGSHDVVVSDNVVADNARGGIGVYDDGPNAISAPVPVVASARPGVDNVVMRNEVRDDGGDCGIVVAAKNPGGGLADNLVRDNTVTGFDPSAGDTSPSVGGIVVAGGAFGAVSVVGTLVVGNTITGGFIPGISLHAAAVITGTHLSNNVLADNGAGAAGGPTGIEILGAPGSTVSDTHVTGDRISNDRFGVFHVGDNDTHIAHLSTTDVAVRLAP